MAKGRRVTGAFCVFQYSAILPTMPPCYPPTRQGDRMRHRPPELHRTRARDMRADATPPADILWQMVKDPRIAGFKVRRQMPLKGYILDFVCFEARLIVDDPLPAGFEIDNPNLIRAGDISALDWVDSLEDTRMTEFRQERFVAAVDWSGSNAFRLAYVVRAVSPGSFHHPAASVMDMYRPDYRARTDTGQVTIAE